MGYNPDSRSRQHRVEHPHLSGDLDVPFFRGVRLHAEYTPSPPEVQDAVQEILDTILSEREREVVRCVVDEGLSLQATANVLGLRAKSHIFRIRERAFAKLRTAICQHEAFRERFNG